MERNRRVIKPYQLALDPRATRDIKKCDKNLATLIKEKHIPKILADPYTVGSRLTGPLKSLLSYHFHHSGTQYRIIYQVIEYNITVIVVAVGKRENIYNIF